MKSVDVGDGEKMCDAEPLEVGQSTELTYG